MTKDDLFGIIYKKDNGEYSIYIDFTSVTKEDVKTIIEILTECIEDKK